MAGGLADSTASASLPVADMERAKRFYSEKLGLTPVAEDPEGVFYRCGNGSIFGLFPTRGHAGGDHTEMGFVVDDLGATMDDLRGRGVTFEEYDLPGLRTENGMATLSVGRGAWFKDTEGNILALIQFDRPMF
jgi:catechol 2,3-dioxygenase-like lactoylglutathione lyase family enzyme